MDKGGKRSVPATHGEDRNLCTVIIIIRYDYFCMLGINRPTFSEWPETDI